jgi:hypothetical protein
MRFLDVFRRGIEKLPIQPERIARGAPFVMTLEGDVYSDLSGRVTDIALAEGAREVVAAGRMVATQGRILEITNESPAYHPSLAQMRHLVERLAGMGADLKGDGGGVVVIVYAAIDENGLGKGGTRYRVANSAAGVELIPE